MMALVCPRLVGVLPGWMGYSTVWRTRSGAAGPNKLQFGSVLQMNFPVPYVMGFGDVPDRFNRGILHLGIYRVAAHLLSLRRVTILS
jgi:hypothetical protein